MVSPIILLRKIVYAANMRQVPPRTRGPGHGSHGPMPRITRTTRPCLPRITRTTRIGARITRVGCLRASRPRISRNRVLRVVRGSRNRVLRVVRGSRRRSCPCGRVTLAPKEGASRHRGSLGGSIRTGAHSSNRRLHQRRSGGRRARSIGEESGSSLSPRPRRSGPPAGGSPVGLRERSPRCGV